MKIPAWTVPLLCLAGAGCATGPQPAGRQAPAASSYSGQPFSVKETADGRIAGQVCGEDINYQIEGDGRSGGSRLIGFVGSGLPSQIAVFQEGDEWAISGSLGTAAGGAAVDLRLSAEALAGRVGFRRFLLARRGDRYEGEMRIAGTDDPAQATVRGATELEAMPKEVQAAVLPSLLSCFVATVGSYGRSPLTVGFGGPPGAQPRESSSVPRQ